MASELEKLLSMGSMAATGGQAQAALGAAQTLYGISQLPRARAEMQRARASAPSLETPAQFYENYKNAYDSELARMQSDAIQQNLATSVQALQGAGGRALVGGLGAATMGAQTAQQQMLAGERAARLEAGQRLATSQERAIERQEARSQRDMAYANQAYQAALGNIGGGIGAIGKGAMFAGQGTQGVGGTGDTQKRTATDMGSNVGKTLKDLEEELEMEKFEFQTGGMMTKGAFNHNTNPIDLVQDGVKVGEATGGEYIINPTQAKKILKESSFAKKLFKRFERNARKNK